MGISLEKGQKIDLEKNGALTRIMVGLGWNPNKTDTGQNFDLDASVFICKADASGNPKLLSDNHFVFYRNLASPNGSVKHSGDNLTGDGDGDDEKVFIDLTKLEPEVTEISFIVTIHDAVARKQNFGQVKNSVIRIVDEATGTELTKYSLEDDFSAETAVQFGSLYKKDGHWRFSAVGSGYKKGLGDFVTIYGGSLA